MAMKVVLIILAIVSQWASLKHLIESEGVINASKDNPKGYSVGFDHCQVMTHRKTVVWKDERNHLLVLRTRWVDACECWRLNWASLLLLLLLPLLLLLLLLLLLPSSTRAPLLIFYDDVSTLAPAPVIPTRCRRGRTITRKMIMTETKTKTMTMGMAMIIDNDNDNFFTLAGGRWEEKEKRITL